MLLPGPSGFAKPPLWCLSSNQPAAPPPCPPSAAGKASQTCGQGAANWLIRGHPALTVGQVVVPSGPHPR
ncbi:hypothetical protein M440DRAFT_1399408 [Trichoderma longibrachiatum ATCC 18648]|uniref:Uncharacterized protein n=1 Tax=Trichoderma longibrachiatum ATCC 18648 TaxID=983965 RepID=A0A2T4C9M9_TRILO|nr:hypothetical protein M440DRAFT_1399408 [Trichoderma longibrachiatum ATCC 18648]